MSAVSSSLPRLLDAYRGKYCKVVFRDGGSSAQAVAFYGWLKDFDERFQMWEGDSDKKSRRRRYCVAFNHADVNRIVLEMGDGA